MILGIEASEAYIIRESPKLSDYENWQHRKDLGFVGGASILDHEGKEICVVGGSDEYGFRFNKVAKYRIQRGSKFHSRRIIATIE